jgi:hypothetical protein
MEKTSRAVGVIVPVVPVSSVLSFFTDARRRHTEEKAAREWHRLVGVKCVTALGKPMGPTDNDRNAVVGPTYPTQTAGPAAFHAKGLYHVSLSPSV